MKKRSLNDAAAREWLRDRTSQVDVSDDSAEVRDGSGSAHPMERVWSELNDIPEAASYPRLSPLLLERLQEPPVGGILGLTPGLGRVVAASLLALGASGGFLFGQSGSGPATGSENSPIAEIALELELANEGWLDVLPPSTFADHVYSFWQLEDLGLTEPEAVLEGDA